MNDSDCESWWIILLNNFVKNFENLLHSEIWCEYLICISIFYQYAPEIKRHLYIQHQCITQCLNYFYIWLRILMSSFINGLGFLLVDLPLKLAIYGPYIYSSLLISATDIIQFYIMLVDNMCLKFSIVCITTLMYILLDKLALSICLLVNPTIFSSTVLTTLKFDVVYVGLKTYIPYLFRLDLIIHILLWTAKASSWCES